MFYVVAALESYTQGAGQPLFPYNVMKSAALRVGPHIIWNHVPMHCAYHQHSKLDRQSPYNQKHIITSLVVCFGFVCNEQLVACNHAFWYKASQAGKATTRKAYNL